MVKERRTRDIVKAYKQGKGIAVIIPPDICELWGLTADDHVNVALIDVGEGWGLPSKDEPLKKGYVREVHLTINRGGGS